ncbi:MAG: O-antigen ligase family protein, partial [bacterium]|nr:O-antigen ligase family protein [bacterium]
MIGGGALILIFLVGLSRLFSGGELSLQRRMDLDFVALKMATDHPFFGVGLGNFLRELPRYFQGTESSFFLQPVHNAYLLILAETGIFGFLLSLYLFYLFFKKLFFRWRSLHFSFPISLACWQAGHFSFFLILFLSLFDHYWWTLQQGQMLLGLIMGLAWGMGKKDDNPKINGENAIMAS